MSLQCGQRYWVIAILVAELILVGQSSAIAQQPQSTARRDKVSAVRQANYTAPDPAPRMMPAAEVANARPLEPLSADQGVTNDPSNRRVAYSSSSRIPSRSSRSPRVAQRSPRMAQRNARSIQAEMLPTPATTMTESEVFGDGAEIVPEGTMIEGDGMEFEGAADFMGGYSSGGCNNCCDSECCDECCFFGPWFWENFSLFGGVHAFKSSPDQGVNGNFGFHEGINWAIPLLERCGIGFQAGVQGVHSDFSGTTTFDDSRGQAFGTAGLFYRPECQLGLQGGAVIDFLADDLQDDRNVTQLRAEISLLGHCGHEFGAWTAMSTGEDSGTTGAQQGTWEATDMFAFFYRHRFCNGATLRGWGGFTSDDEGLIGGDAQVPITLRWSLASAFNFRIPSEDTRLAEAREEGWGMSLSLVWNLGYDDCESRSNRYRPLFNVADNSTFMLRRR